MALVKKENNLLVFFSSFQLLYQLSVNLVIPFFSVILLSLGWNEATISYFFSIGFLTVFLLAPGIGKLSDYVSKKLLMLLGLLTQILFFISMYFFGEYSSIMVYARVIDMIGFIAIGVVGLGALEDLIKEKRGFWTGVFLTLGTVGGLFGPIVAGYISDHYADKLLLILGAIASFVAMVFLAALPLKTHIKKKESKKSLIQEINPLNEIKHFIVEKRMRGMGIMGLVMNAKGQIFIIFFPIYAIKVLNISETYLGFLLMIPIAMHLFQTQLGKISDYISAQFGVLCGAFVACFSMIFLPYLSTIPELVVLLVIMGLGNSMWNVNAWSLMGDYAKRNQIEGEVSGTYFSLSKLGAFIATGSTSLLLTFFTLATMIQFFAGVVLITMCFCYFLFAPIFHHENRRNHFLKHFQ